MLLVIGGYYVYNGVEPNYDLNYRINSTFNHNSLAITVKDAMVTNVDYAGNLIEKDSYYVVLKMNIKNY